MSDAIEPYAHCAATVRDRDRDRYLADLFAPEPRRRHLFALQAFNVEVARIRDVVSDPALGEIRLQWWHDALAGGGGHPVATALVKTIGACALPTAPFERLLDARMFDLYDDPMPSLNDLKGYAGETASSLFQFSAIVLAGGDNPRSTEAAGHAGVAHTLTGIMRALPVHSARAQCYLPDDMVGAHALDRGSLLARRNTPQLVALLAELRAITRRHLAEAERAAAELAAAIKPAFLPLSLIGPYLDRMDRPNYDPLSGVVELAPWRRQWIIWRAAGRGRRRADR